MKKVYNSPITKVVNIRVQNQVLTGSLTGDYVKSGAAGSSENLSRGGFLWDSDDDIDD